MSLLSLKREVRRAPRSGCMWARVPSTHCKPHSQSQRIAIPQSTKHRYQLIDRSIDRDLHSSVRCPIGCPASSCCNGRLVQWPARRWSSAAIAMADSPSRLVGRATRASSADKKAGRLPVWLYLPNLIGYARLLLSVYGLSMVAGTVRRRGALSYICAIDGSGEK